MMLFYRNIISLSQCICFLFLYIKKILDFWKLAVRGGLQNPYAQVLGLGVVRLIILTNHLQSGSVIADFTRTAVSLMEGYRHMCFEISKRYCGRVGGIKVFVYQLQGTDFIPKSHGEDFLKYIPIMGRFCRP